MENCTKIKLLEALELESEINGVVTFETIDGKRERIVQIVGLLNEELSYPTKRKLRKLDALLKEEKSFHDQERVKIIEKHKNAETGKLDEQGEELAQKEYEELLTTDVEINIPKFKIEELTFTSKNSYPFTDRYLIED